ncbi:hypothetical protein ASE77_17325 [Sphingomonas sp. Leaf226]|nr:hypothetical protein ASE77_17325 [Sphingomonas sp. Leaf226]
MRGAIDDYSRDYLVRIANTLPSDQRSVRELILTAERRRLPCTVVCVNGTELTGHAFFDYRQHTGVG